MRHPRVLPALALAVLAAALAADHAAAQGTSGMLPGPISSRDLVLYADHLGLSETQRRALEPFHDEYREAFRELRETDIQQYLDEVGGLWRRGFRALDPEGVKDSLQKLDRLMTRIRLVDDQLFNGIQSVLADDQVAELPRIMQARERQRLRAGGTRMVGFANQAARVDLSRVWAGLDLADEEREATEPFIRTYETRLTAATRELHEATTRIFLTISESLQDQGVDLSDPGRMADPQQFMDAMSTAWTEAIKEPRDKASAIGDLNWRALRQVSEFLSPDAVVSFRDRYLRRAYPEVPRSGSSAAVRGYRAALGEDLPADLESAVRSAQAEFRTSRDAVVAEMVEYLDGYRRQWTPRFRGRGGADRDAHRQKLDEFRARLAAMDESALEGLESLLGDRMTTAIRAAAAASGADADEDEPGPRGGRRGGGGATEDALVAFARGLGPDPYLPQPISRRDVRSYGRALDLDENAWFILESLHEEYASSFKRIQRQEIAALRDAQAAVLGPDDEDDEQAAAPATPEQIDALYALRRRAMASIREADDLFFDDLETIVAAPGQEPAARRLRLARERVVYNRGRGADAADLFRGRGRGRGGWPGLGGGSQEASVDLAYLVDGLDLEASSRAEVDKTLLAYETAANEAFRRQYVTALGMRQAVDRARAEWARQRGEDAAGRGGPGRWQAYRDLMENEGRAAREARKTIVDLNRATLSSLAESLPADAAEALREQYNRVAFPTLYDDPEAAGRYLAAALELTDLDDGQRGRIETIRNEYEPAHERVAAEMAAIYAAAEDAEGGPDRRRWQAMMEQRNRLEVLEFDRAEINAKALRGLREVLSDRQQTQIHLPQETTPDDQG